MGDFDKDEETEELSLEAAAILKDAGRDQDAPDEHEETVELSPEPEVEAYAPDAALHGTEAEDSDVDAENIGEPKMPLLAEGDLFETRFGEGKVESIVAHPNGMHAKVVLTAIVEVTAAELSEKLSG